MMRRVSRASATLRGGGAVRLATYTYRQSTVHDTTSAAFKERRAQASKWETAVFGKMFYEPGMRERFAAATRAEEEERLKTEAEMKVGGPDAYHKDMTVEQVKLQPLPVVKKHVVSLLTRGERRIIDAPDYGSYMMMQYMHAGEQMIDDAETLLRHFGLMTADMEESIDDLRSKGKQIKYDLDLVN